MQEIRHQVGDHLRRQKERERTSIEDFAAGRDDIERNESGGAELWEQKSEDCSCERCDNRGWQGVRKQQPGAGRVVRHRRISGEEKGEGAKVAKMLGEETEELKRLSRS